MKINFKSWLEEIAMPTLPKILYHATYGKFVKSILKKGLIPRYFCVWEDCETGVYLANDPHEAMSYPETTDNPSITDDDIDNIVVFAIDVNKLDKSKIEVDPHIKWNENPLNVSTFIYKEIIPTTTFLNINKIKNGGNGL